MRRKRLKEKKVFKDCMRAKEFVVLAFEQLNDIVLFCILIICRYLKLLYKLNKQMQT